MREEGRDTFNNRMSYFIPDHGQPKTSLRIPESHNLYVCPSACGRRHAIRAFKNGEKKHCSFLYITEADVVSGHYEETVGDAVAELLDVLESPPKAFMIHVNCIDDFLGTDEQALLEQLRARFPSQRFAVLHINPVAIDEKIPPGMRMHDQLYSFLEYSGKKDDGVNLIGNYVALDPESELFTVLAACGIHHVRQIFDCRTYADYLKLADSCLNLVLMPMGRLAAQNMAAMLGIPCLFNPISYDMDVVMSDYRRLTALLGQDCPDFSSEIQATQAEIQATLALIGSMPVIVDSSATMQPFALARALQRYGFQIRAIFAQRLKGTDLTDRDWLVEHCPHIPIVQAKNYEAILGYDLGKDCVAIGYDSAFTIQAQHLVDIRHDESFYGFHGIRTLMRLIRRACDTQVKW